MTEAAPTISFPKLECPDTILPTKKDLFEAFDGAAAFPARLRAYAAGLAGDEAQKWIDQADQIDELLDGIKTALSQWDPKNKKPYIPGKDWEKLISRLREDYNMFVQKSILEIMATVIPIEFTVPILGIQIDLIALVTDPSSIKETIKGDIDKLYALLPEEFQSFKGEFGLDSDEYKNYAAFSEDILLGTSSSAKALRDSGKISKMVKNPALRRQLENQITEKLGKAKGEEGATAKDTVKITKE